MTCKRQRQELCDVEDLLEEYERPRGVRGFGAIGLKGHMTGNQGFDHFTLLFTLPSHTCNCNGVGSESFILFILMKTLAA